MNTHAILGLLYTVLLAVLLDEVNRSRRILRLKSKALRAIS